MIVIIACIMQIGGCALAIISSVSEVSDLTGVILGLVSMAIGAIMSAVDYGKSERKQQSDLSTSISYTEIIAKTVESTTFRVYYTNGASNVVDIGNNHPYYRIYFSKLR